MSKPHEAYATAARHGNDPRELEASVLLKSASRLQRIKDGWSATMADLNPALTYNRTLWTIFVTSVTEGESQLPKEVRQNIANLALFIFKRTVEVQATPAPELLDSLININRQIAAGLLQKAS
ncbi:MAG: flagellar biosynthesis regulator FlaF [Parvibaculum sp.]|jgi:flagellar protein FlaF|uniref:flagellar biosynthesis regulator FlaF n=1 Tax=Parvibaculum sp. TaxID=2024848 RepID=UPI0025DAAAD7|nr:flagellar biosynthesis regulator FlaF [Parvibaculum sp.]MCE9650703.1 flagellar biosynthesis regulator FlaF [Parvibaculum sp.]